jgi:hypothetical protein
LKLRTTSICFDRGTQLFVSIALTLSRVVTDESDKENEIQDYWVFGLCPSSGILKKQKNTTFRKLDLFPSLGEGAGDSYSVGLVRKSEPQSLDQSV